MHILRIDEQLKILNRRNNLLQKLKKNRIKRSIDIEHNLEQNLLISRNLKV